MGLSPNRLAKATAFFAFMGENWSVPRVAGAGSRVAVPLPIAHLQQVADVYVQQPAKETKTVGKLCNRQMTPLFFFATARNNIVQPLGDTSFFSVQPVTYLCKV